MVSARSRPGHCRGSPLFFQREVAQLTGAAHVVDSCVLRRLALRLRGGCRSVERVMLRAVISGAGFVLCALLLLALMMATASATITPGFLYSSVSPYALEGGPARGTTPSAVCAALSAGALYAGWSYKLVPYGTNGACEADDSNHKAQDLSIIQAVAGSCPANSYGTDTCVCNAGFTDNGANACVPVSNCKAAGTTTQFV